MKTTLFLFGAAITIRLAVISWWQFDGLYGQDAYAYLNQAVAIRTYLPQGYLPPTDFFWPNGYPLLVALIMPITGQTAWAGQMTALVCGAALSPLVYLLSKDLWPGGRYLTRGQGQQTGEEARQVGYLAGILAGLMAAVAGQAILSAVVVMADTPALFWAAVSAWLVVRTVNRRDNRAGYLYDGLYFLAAGATLGLAIISRWLYILLAPALTAYTLYHLRQSWRLALPAILGGAMVLAPQVWLSLQKSEGLTHSWLTGWHPANFWQRQFYNVDGHFVYPLPNAVFYAQPAIHPAFIFPLLGLAAAWSVWQLSQTKQWGILILLLGWAGPVYLFLAGIPYQNLRFGLTLYPPLIILAGYGVALVLRRGREQTLSCWKIGRDKPRIISPTSLLPWPPTLIKSAVLASLLATLVWAYPMLNSFLNTQNHSKQIAQQVAQLLSPEATLVTFGLTLTLQYYTPLHTLELFHLSQTDLATLAGSPQEFYLLLNVSNLESQWQGQTPQLHYDWLKNHTTLHQIGDFPPYQLYRVVKEPKETHVGLYHQE
jgi:hypothetical protein